MVRGDNLISVDSLGKITTFNKLGRATIDFDDKY